MQMLSRASLSCLFASAAAVVPAQASVSDVGLTIDDGAGGTIGQLCGTVSCFPIAIGPLVAGTLRGVGHASAEVTPYAIAIGFPGPCAIVPGIGNMLLLGGPVILDVGVTSIPPLVPTPCEQGVAAYSLVIPAGAPVGLTVRLQSIGFGMSGEAAFSPALEGTIQ
jgi:hypothetical protein